MESILSLKLILTIVIGAILGLETETRHIEKSGEKAVRLKERLMLGGVRTYTIISLFGGVSGLLYLNGEIILSYILFSSIILLILAAYVLNVVQKKAFGMTTEVAVIITYILGFLTTSSIVPVEIIIVIMVLLAFFLSNKRGISQLVNKIEHKEIVDLFKFALVALVILPILPNKSILLKDIALFLNIPVNILGPSSDLVVGNPFTIWMLVVIISGFGLLGYILSRAFGEKRGVLVTGFFSGFISSTAALLAFANKSRGIKNELKIKLYASSFLFSNAASFILLGVILAINSLKAFELVLPFFIIFFVCSLVIGIILTKGILSQDGLEKEKINYQPFSILPALKFVGIILSINLLVQFFIIQNVSPNFLVVLSSISGITGVDAPSIALSSLSEKGVITFAVAAIAIVITNYINFAGKSILAFLFGNKKFAGYIVLSLSITVGISLLYFVLK